MTEPTTLLATVEDGAARLERAADAFHDATLRYEKAEAGYERELQKQLLVIYHRAKEAKERPPAEDIRRALAHEGISAEVYGEYLEAKAHKEALAVRYRALAASVSARQSLLKHMGGP